MECDRFMICVDNKGYEASLALGKIYYAIFIKHDIVGIIDESEECYIYSINRFREVDDDYHKRHRRS